MTDSSQLEARPDTSSKTPLRLNPLDAIQARANIATKGPWTVPPHSSPLRDEVTAPSDSGLSVAVCEVRSPAPNAVFIAHAREDVPKLVAALRAVEAMHPKVCTFVGDFKCEAGDNCTVSVCGPCGDSWPCPPISVIRDALA